MLIYMHVIAGYRTMANKSQREMAKLLGISLGAYRNKESGAVEFKQSEMKIFYSIIKKVVPNITIEDIFFTD